MLYWIVGEQINTTTLLNALMKIRILIVDDQLIGREALHHLLQREPDLEIVGMAANGCEAVECINRLAPDLVFLDVQMPDLDGFEVAAKINRTRMPIVIFVTARDDVALKAFDAHALDYIVKPCQPERLRLALQRARQQIQRNQTGEIQRKLDELLRDLKVSSGYPQRLTIKSNGRILFLRVNDINLVEAAGNYVKLFVGNETYLYRETMTALEEKLPPEHFLRISRSAIVNVESVKELHPLFHGEYMVSLRNGTRVTLTRGYREQLRQLGVPA
jgi:two-component system, LytTR family, response regulator